MTRRQAAPAFGIGSRGAREERRGKSASPSINVSTERALQIATYVLVIDGVAALYVSSLIDLPGLALISFALGAAWYRHRLYGISRRVFALTIGLLGVAAVLDLISIMFNLVYFGESILVAFVHLLVALVILRLFTARSGLDLRNAGLISFFILVGSSAVGFGVEFLFVFVIFLPLGTWMLVLSHLVTESQRAAQGPGTVPLPVALTPGLASLSATAALASLLVTAGLFFIIPRVGEATLALRAGFGRMVSGFSENVRLGAIGEIELDETVVMRVHLPDGVPAPEIPALRWRGIALDYFDGGGWSVSRPERVPLRSSTPGTFEISPPHSSRTPFRQTVMLEPIGTDVIFAAPRAVRASIREGVLLTDDQGTLAVPNPTARVEYAVESELEESLQGSRETASVRDPLDPAGRARYLQLPVISPRIPALARQIHETRGPEDAARALTEYFAHDFRYTLNLTRTTSLSPLEEFLFVRRAGNCEYFAAALAVMLRSVDIPARVVNGFQRGEWNPYGRYFAVRLPDAHAWVEAYVDGRGWITLDPSPRVDAASLAPSGGLSLYLDLFRMHLNTLRNRWNRYIVGWSRQDQVDVATTMRRMAWQFRPRLPWWRGWADPRRLIGLGLAFAIVVVAWAWWRRPTSASPWRGSAVPKFYRHALRALARSGLRAGSGETAREFSARVAVALPGAGEPFARITAAYERVRFGAGTLTASEVSTLQTAIASFKTR